MNIIDINSLKANCLLRVMHFLTDQDVQNFGLCSKKILEVAKISIEIRDNNLNEILSEYKVSHYFNVKSIQDADTLLIGERHYEKGCISDQRKLIEHLALRGRITVIYESVPALEVLEETLIKDIVRKRNLESLCNIIKSKDIILTGWDNIKAVQQVFRDSEQPIFEFFEKYLEKEIEHCELYCDAINKLGIATDDCIEYFKNENSISEIDKDTFNSDNLLFIQKRHQFLIKYMEMVIRLQFVVLEFKEGKISISGVSEVYQQEQEKIRKKIDELNQEEINKGLNSSDIFLIKRNNISDYFKEGAIECNSKSKETERFLTSQTFPVRTEIFTDTLRNIKQWQQKYQENNSLKNSKVKNVFVAGSSHLCRHIFNKKNENYNLTKFHEELKNHKAVILLPPGVKVLSPEQCIDLDCGEGKEKYYIDPTLLDPNYSNN